jgi:hypothetical protein
MLENETKVNFFNDEAPVSSVEVESEEQPAELVEAKTTGDSDKMSKAEQKAVVKEIKRLQALYGDDKYDIPVDAKLKHKVDNEEVELSMQDLLNNYSGKQSWDKKFTELDKERTTHKKELEYVNQYVAEFARRSKEDPVAAFEFLAEFAGADPLEFRKNLRTQFVSKWGDYLQLDEASRRQIDMQEENEYFRKKYENQIQRERAEQGRMQLEAQFAEVEKSHNISKERRSELEKDLRELGNVQSITPEMVVSLHQAYERQDRAIAALDKLNPEFVSDNTKFTLAESLLTSNPNMTDAELSDMLHKLWGNDIQKAVNSLEKQKPKSKQPAAQNYKPKVFSTGNVNFFE